MQRFTLRWRNKNWNACATIISTLKVIKKKKELQTEFEYTKEYVKPVKPRLAAESYQLDDF